MTHQLRMSLQRDNLRSAVLLTNQKLTAKLATDVPCAKYVDLDTLMRNTINTKAAPFTDVTTQCLNNNRKCASEASHFFWDDTHLTTVAHEKVGSDGHCNFRHTCVLVCSKLPSSPVQ